MLKRYLVDELGIKSADVETLLRWDHKRNSLGITLIMGMAIAGIGLIAATSFLLFFRWSENFISVNQGRAGMRLGSIFSIILPPLGILLDILSSIWIWYDYQKAGFPVLDYNNGIAAVFIVFAVISLLLLTACCGLNILRAKYATELVDLHFSAEGMLKTNMTHNL